MQTSGTPSLTCGRTFNVHLPGSNDPPITLAAVKVNTGGIDAPNVLLNYSSIIESRFSGSNPILNIVYRLVRKSNLTRKAKVLETWNLSAQELIPTRGGNSFSIEPLVLNFCDCLDDIRDDSFTYILQLAKINLNNVTLNIGNQEISAIVSHGDT